MKQFNEPTIEILKLEDVDVLSTSTQVFSDDLEWA